MDIIRDSLIRPTD